MSRSGYSIDLDSRELAMWRGTIASATRGKRGQQFFRDLVAALDALPAKRLIANALGTETPEGDVCALGSVARLKSVPLSEGDAYDHDKLGETFNIARQLAQEVMYENDDGGPWRPYHQTETPEERWTRVRAWAAGQIRVKEVSR